MEVDSTGADSIVLTNPASYVGASNVVIDITGIGTPSHASRLTLLTSPGGISLYEAQPWRNFRLGTVTGDFAGYSLTITGDMTHIYLEQTPIAVVPEAGSLGVLGIGVAGLLGWRQRKAAV